MPVAFLRPGPAGGFAPLVQAAVRLGRDPGCTIVDDAPGVAAHHASVKSVRGEWVLTPRAGCRVEVNGDDVPFMALRDGDVVRLAPGAAPWTFRNRMQDAFVPPGGSLAAAWAAHPAFRDPDVGPARFGPGRPVAGRPLARCARVRVEGGDAVLKRLGPGRAPDAGDRHLRLLAATGGAPHPGLAPILDGGLTPVPEGGSSGSPGAAERWILTAWVDGRSARDLVAAGALPYEQVLRVLRPLAGALAHLHARGVVHRDVSPGNVVVTPAGEGVLIDLGHAFRPDDPLPASTGIVGTPGYVAPEEVAGGPAGVAPPVDVYGLGAVGYALLTGRAPAAGEDVLASLSRAARPPPRPTEVGVEAPGALEDLLLEALAPDPATRPDAAAFGSVLAFVHARLALGS